MSVTRLSIFADVSHIIGALKAYTPAGAATSYSEAAAGTIVTGTNYISADWSQGKVQDACIDGEMDAIYEVCNTSQHPDRSLFLLDSSTVLSGAVLPSSSSGSVRFIGPVSSVRDATNSKVCFPAQAEEVKWVAENENSMYGTDIYKWALDGEVLLHTRASGVIVRRAGYARPSFSGNLALPDQYKPMVVSAAILHLLTKEGMFSDVFAQHAQLYQGWADTIRGIGNAPTMPAAKGYPTK